MPFAEPEDPVPATVVTAPVEITILRIRLASVTYRFVPSVVIPKGLENLADVPVPSHEPEDPDPASVVTAVERLSAVPWMDPPISEKEVPIP